MREKRSTTPAVFGGSARRAMLMLALAPLCAPAAHADELRGKSTPGSDDLVTCTRDADPCFTLLGVQLVGAAAMPASAFADIFEPYLARPVSTPDLARIAQAVTDRYRAQGYFLTRAVVPPQDGAGIARIHVLEGRIGEVRVEGDAAAAVASYFDGLSEAQAAGLSELDRRLAMANDLPGVRVHTRMEPIEGDERAHRLVVTAEREERISVNAAIDNRGGERAGPLQALARVTVNGAWLERDQASLSFFTTPQDPSEFSLIEGAWSYTFANGGRARVVGAISRTQDGPNVASNEVGGDSEALSIQYEYPLVRQRNAGLWLGASLSSRRQRNDWMGGGGYADDLRVARAGLRGTLNEDGHATTLFVQASLGLDALGASGPSPTRRSRFDADGEFVKVSAFASHYMDIGDYFGIYAAAGGQWSDGPLLQAEEFSAGGPPFGRAYNYGEIAADEGIGAMVELRAGFDPDGDLLSFAQAYLFYDAARVWDHADMGALEDSIASAGGGVRLTFAQRVTAGFELARPLDAAPAEEGDKDWRQFFSLTATY